MPRLTEPRPDGPRIGDIVRITDHTSPFYNRTAVVTREAKGVKLLRVRFRFDEEEVRLPWGYQIVETLPKAKGTFTGRRSGRGGVGYNIENT